MYSFKYIQKTLKNIKSQINKLKMYLKNLVKQYTLKLKNSRWGDINKTRAKLMKLKEIKKNIKSQ